MIVRGGTTHLTEVEADVVPVAPGVGRVVCVECDGDPESYAARFGRLRNELAPDGCVDCKNRGGSMSALRKYQTDSYRRVTYTLPPEEAHAMAASWLRKFPKAAYDTVVESWRVTGDGKIEFTMRRLPTAD